MNVLNLDFLTALDQLLGSSPYVSCISWGRSIQHNEDCGGAPGSHHRYWDAVDMICDQSSQLIPLSAKALALGFPGIELDLTNQHLHLDWRTDKIWHVVKQHTGDSPLSTYLNKEVV